MLSNYRTIGCWEANELLKFLTDQFQYLHITYNAIFIRTFCELQIIQSFACGRSIPAEAAIWLAVTPDSLNWPTPFTPSCETRYLAQSLHCFKMAR